MIVACACLCNGSDRLIRKFLQENDYPDWMAIDVPHGKEKSRRLISTLPGYPEKQEIDLFLQNSSKWALIIGYNENGCRWVDIAHPTAKSKVDGRHLIETFK